ncbi:hypothetical protein JMN32_06380 [Fulvivirga sp. 29W222]|uniref:Uncharacterized protein n=1 Tax=Fulvivirga marina TaxID=2494733 RepID=A0A937FWZ6_9BACT|nr:hypothetical protein [Fulvivirga marina]MBL6445926.1 hypothetical protein [Fulvivirga marina]
MGDNSFLKHFITEPVFVIPGEELVASITGSREEKAEAIVEEAPAIYQSQEATKKKAKEVTFKGSNKKQILVIVDQPGEEFINAADESFLSKIMGAIKLDINDIAIINFSNNSELNKELLLDFSATRYLMFGIDDSKLLKGNFPPYQIMDIGNNKQVLICSALATIASDPSQKKLLWTALQKMFL